MTRLSTAVALTEGYRSSSRPGDTITSVLAERARTTPDDVAFRFLGETAESEVSYAELHRWSQSIAARIRMLVPEGARAVILLPPGIEFVPTIFACFAARIIAVPMDLPRKRNRFGRLDAILADCAPDLLISTASELADLARKRELPPALADMEWLAVDDVAAGDEADVDLDGPAPDDLAFLQYTSGSTATPKGVMVSHENLIATLTDLDRGWSEDADRSFVTWLPTFHDMGLIYGVLLPIFCGSPCYAMSPTSFLQQPVRWLEMISEYGAVNSAAPTFAYDLCARRITEEQARSLDLSSWKVALVGAEPIHPETLERFVRALEPSGFRPEAIYCGYGLAEATLKATTPFSGEPTQLLTASSGELARGRVVPCPADAPDAQRLVGCGGTHIATRVAIVDPETRLELPPDRVGEVWLSGASVARGYWERPEATEETFRARLADTDEGPFLRTGDLGFVWEGGLFLAGRIKDLMVVRGLNFYPQDIEIAARKAHPAAEAGLAAAFSVDSDEGERVVIVQEIPRTSLRGLDADAVIRAIREAVWDVHELEVSAVVLVRPATIARTSSGKIQRFQCRRRFEAGELSVVAEWRAPRVERDRPTPSPVVEGGALDSASLEAWTRRWIAARLGLPEAAVASDVSFADFGLDSVSAVELAADLRTLLGDKTLVSDTVLWEYPTIRSVAEGLAPRNGSAAIAEPAADDLADVSDARLLELLRAELEDA